jgi:hypothetical protein
MPVNLNQMFVDTCMAVKGWFDIAALDKKAKQSDASVTATEYFRAGSVCVLDVAAGAGGFTLATQDLCKVGGYKTAVPLFIMSPKSRADVTASEYNYAGTTRSWASGFPDGTYTALVGTGGYEIQTTNFTASSGLDYASNQLLTVDIDGAGTVPTASAIGTAGVLTNAVTSGNAPDPYDDWIVGITSTHVNAPTGDYNPDTVAAADTGYVNTPLGYNANYQQTLTFWTYFLPAV